MTFGFEVRQHEKEMKKNRSFEGYKKQFVSVHCIHTKEAHIIPQIIVFDDLTKYQIDKVLDVRKAASLKVGGVGLRYTIKVCGKETFLFFDENEKKWFVEAKQHIC